MSVYAMTNAANEQVRTLASLMGGLLALDVYGIRDANQVIKSQMGI